MLILAKANKGRSTCTGSSRQWITFQGRRKQQRQAKKEEVKENLVCVGISCGLEGHIAAKAYVNLQRTFSLMKRWPWIVFSLFVCSKAASEEKARKLVDMTLRGCTTLWLRRRGELRTEFQRTLLSSDMSLVLAKPVVHFVCIALVWVSTIRWRAKTLVAMDRISFKRICRGEQGGRWPASPQGHMNQRANNPLL